MRRQTQQRSIETFLGPVADLISGGPKGRQEWTVKTGEGRGQCEVAQVNEGREPSCQCCGINRELGQSMP